MDDFVRRCVDLDEWKYSWHNKWSCLDDYEQARQVIKEKIDGRIEELRLLSDGLSQIDCIIARERDSL